MKILNGRNLALKVLTCGLKQNMKWGFHCSVQTAAASLTVSFPTTHPIIRFTCDMHLCCRNSLLLAHSNKGKICCISFLSLKPTSSLQGGKRCLPRFSFFSLNTMTSLERQLLHWMPPNPSTRTNIFQRMSNSATCINSNSS
jgi:hypothetical protein